MTGHWKDHGFDRQRYFVRKTDPAIADAIEAIETIPARGALSGHIANLVEWFRGTVRDCAKRYFVLRYDCENGEPADPHARHALAKYAESVQFDNQQFAADLFEALRITGTDDDTREISKEVVEQAVERAADLDALRTAIEKAWPMIPKDHKARRLLRAALGLPRET